MAVKPGKYEKKAEKVKKGCPWLLIPLFFFLTEVFGFLHLWPQSGNTPWPLIFGGLWTVILSALLRILPEKGSRIAFGILAGASLVYSVGQTGYYQLFSEMMWISEFRYASEGSDYLDILLNYPITWFLWITGLLALALVLVWKYPLQSSRIWPRAVSVLLAALAVFGLFRLPEKTFAGDGDIRYAKSDYGRMQSAEAAYENMFNAHRLYQLCGLYHTAAKDIYTNMVYPLTPGYAQEQKKAETQIADYFVENQQTTPENAMTALLAGKNVVLVLMESMDDWMIGEHTPTIERLMSEGVNFTRFHTPVYGGIRTFNTEFTINTGSFLSSQGGYAFDYVTNAYPQSLANRLREAGYSAKTFHYNDPSFYSRGEFSPAMGYEEYVCYGDYITETDEKTVKNLLYDDLLLFDNRGLNAEFFREGKPTFNFIITRSAHLSYKYNEVLSYWGLKKYPQYKGMTGNEETDCAYLKAKLVDDLFARLMTELEQKGQLENTVIIGVTDHYTYGYKDMESLLALSGVREEILLERTPCFIWSADLEPMVVDKVLNTSDLLPTVMNLLNVDTEHAYIGHDAFDEGYAGFVPFSNGSWIYGDIAYDASEKKYLSISGKKQTVTAELQKEMADTVQEFIRINNLILDTDYYRK